MAGGFAAHAPLQAPGCSTHHQVFQKAPGLHQQPEGRAGSVGTNRAPLGSGHGVTMSSWHSSAPTPFSFSLLCAQGRRQAWGSSGRQGHPSTLQKTVCMHSPVSSGVTTAVSRAVSPAVAGLVAPRHGTGYQAALLGPARLWHRVLVVMAAPGHGQSGQAGAGPCPWGGGTEEQRCCETPGCGSHPLPTAGHTWGTHPLMQVALGMV